MKPFDVYPLNNITITKAEGSRVWDDSGNSYLDFYGGHAVISIGHSHPHWTNRIGQQLKQVAFYSNSVHIPIQRELAEKMGSLSQKEDYQLFLVNSGAEANENALKLASFHTGRKKIIAFSKAFHGRTSLAVSATDNPAIVAPVNQTDNIVFLPFNDQNALQEYFDRNGQQVAAVIIEPIQGVGGIHVAEKEFMLLLRKLCNSHGSLLIADEVQCGQGRTGAFFAMDHSGVLADIYTMAKGMGNGFPVGGIMIAPYIKPKHGMLGTTFGGSHLACAAALAVIEVMEKEQLIENAKKQGAYLLSELNKVEEISNVRGQGLMIGFDLPVNLKDLKKELLMTHRIFTGEAKPDVIRLLPALTISTKEIDEFMTALKTSVAHLISKSVDQTVHSNA